MVAERSSGSTDPVDPADFERAEIPTVFRGADPAVVRRLLSLAAGEIRRLRDELDSLPEPVPVTAAEPAVLDEATLTARLGEEAAMVLTAAREAAAQVRARAEEKVARLVREAQHEANEIRAAADRERALVLQEARDEAATTREAADRVHDEARAQVQAELDTAHERAQDVVSAAQRDRDQVLADLAHRRDVLAAEIAELDQMRTDAATLLGQISAGLGRHAERLHPDANATAAPVDPDPIAASQPVVAIAATPVEPAPAPEVEVGAVEPSESEPPEIGSATVVDPSEPGPEPLADSPELRSAPVAESSEIEPAESDVRDADVPLPELDDEDDAGDPNSPVQVRRRRRRRDDGLPRGDVSQFRVEPTDEIEIVRIVDADDDPVVTPERAEPVVESVASEPVVEEQAPVTAVDESSERVELEPAVERPEPVIEAEVEDGEPAELDDEPAIDAEVVADLDADTADGGPIAAGSEAVDDLDQGPAADTPAELDLREPAPRPVEPLLAHDDLPIRLSAGGPLDPRPGEYVVDPTPPGGVLDPREVATIAAAAAEQGIDLAAAESVVDEEQLASTSSTGIDLTETEDARIDLAEIEDAGIDLTETEDAGIDLAEIEDAGIDLTSADEPAEPVEPTFLDGVFARLRAERTARTEEARTVLADTATATATLLREETPVRADDVEPVGHATPVGADDVEPVEHATPVAADDVEPVGNATPVAADDVEPPAEPEMVAEASHDALGALFARRDDLLLQHAVALSSQLKRVLADRQNALLDGLNRGAPLEELATDTQAAYRAAAVDELAEAATAASSIMGEPFVVDTDDLATALATELTQPLFRRVHAAVESGPDGLAGRVRAIHREWRSERVGSVAEGFVGAAVARGVIAGTALGAPVRWACDPNHGFPDGTDNELAGVVANGDAFPTGHTTAPIYLGCRCLVVPA
ncbi:MAG: hypothetical protein AAGA99_03240 [Actinomycetota bacterium]